MNSLVCSSNSSSADISLTWIHTLIILGWPPMCAIHYVHAQAWKCFLRLKNKGAIHILFEPSLTACMRRQRSWSIIWLCQVSLSFHRIGLAKPPPIPPLRPASYFLNPSSNILIVWSRLSFTVRWKKSKILLFVHVVRSALGLFSFGLEDFYSILV